MTIANSCDSDIVIVAPFSRCGASRATHGRRTWQSGLFAFASLGGRSVSRQMATSSVRLKVWVAVRRPQGGSRADDQETLYSFGGCDKGT